MAVQKPTSPLVELDLEATAELPVIDFDDASAANTQVLPDVATATDVFPTPVVPAGMADLADSLRDVEHRLQIKSERVRTLESSLAAALQQVEALGAQLAQVQQRASVQINHECDLQELRQRSERQHEALSTWWGFRAVSESRLAEVEAQCAQLQDNLALARASAVAPLASPAQQQITALQAELDAAGERQYEAQAQLRASAERLQRLETEAHASAALLGNLQQHLERMGRDDTGARLALQNAAGEIPLRVLIRLDDGVEIVYPLARRTSVGRTPDNDIQVDTTFISRHHAVLLSSPDHCIVEDLNSTNGVLVNGRRIGRQILHDGDAVTVGRTEFRYQQRS